MSNNKINEITRHEREVGAEFATDIFSGLLSEEVRNRKTK